MRSHEGIYEARIEESEFDALFRDRVPRREGQWEMSRNEGMLDKVVSMMSIADVDDTTCSE